DLHDGDAGDLVAGQDGGGDGRGAAVAWQQRGVDVQGAAPGHLKDSFAQYLPIGRDDDNVRLEPAQALDRRGRADVAGLEDGEAVLEREDLCRRRRGSAAAARGPVRLGHDGDDFVPGAEEGADGGDGEFGGAHEDDAHAEILGPAPPDRPQEAAILAKQTPPPNNRRGHRSSGLRLAASGGDDKRALPPDPPATARYRSL